MNKQPKQNLLHCKEYGQAGPRVIVLHGGPAAAGSVQPLAQELGACCRVLEPWQRETREAKLTVASHVRDLFDLIHTRYPNEKPALIGHSWGAMLALAYAAKHGDTVGKLILISCGTFDLKSRKQLQTRHEQLLTPEKQARLREIKSIPDPAEKSTRLAYFFDDLYACDRIPNSQPKVKFDLDSHHQTWNDMLQLQQAGVYPQAFAQIKNPVVMIHGCLDPHPGPMICENLKQYIPHIEYIELARCGHTPWEEKHAREPFYTVLKERLKQ